MRRRDSSKDAKGRVGRDFVVRPLFAYHGKPIIAESSMPSLLPRSRCSQARRESWLLWREGRHCFVELWEVAAERDAGPGRGWRAWQQEAQEKQEETLSCPC